MSRSEMVSAVARPFTSSAPASQQTKATDVTRAPSEAETGSSPVTVRFDEQLPWLISVDGAPSADDIILELYGIRAPVPLERYGAAGVGELGLSAASEFIVSPALLRAPYAERYQALVTARRLSLEPELEGDFKQIVTMLDVPTTFYYGIEGRVVTILERWAREPFWPEPPRNRRLIGTSYYLNELLLKLSNKSKDVGVIREVWTSYYDLMFTHFDRVDELRRVRDQHSYSFQGEDALPEPEGFFGILWEDVKSGRAAERIGAAVEGMWDAGVAFVEGTIDFAVGLVTDPIGTLRGAYEAIVNLPETVATLWEHRGELWDSFVNASPREQARMIGRLFGEILVGIGTGGTGGTTAASKVAGVADVARDAGRVVRAAEEVVDVATGARRALGAAEDVLPAHLPEMPRGATPHLEPPGRPSAREPIDLPEAGPLELETAQEWLAGQPPYSRGPNAPTPIDLPEAGPLELETAQEWIARQPRHPRGVNAPAPLDLPRRQRNDPRSLLTKDDERNLVQFDPDINREAAHRAPTRYEPPPGGGTTPIEARTYTHDAQGNLLEATTENLSLGVRDPVMYSGLPGLKAGEDFGHLLGIDFGHIDAQLGRHGGFRQASAVNRPMGGGVAPAWYNAERECLSRALRLHEAGRPYRVVARAEGHINGVPGRTRILLESGGGVVWDSGWIANPAR